MPTAMLVYDFPTEARFGVTSRWARPKYFSYTSQPFRTTSMPPFFVLA
jgi:hypothetical protein